MSMWDDDVDDVYRARAEPEPGPEANRNEN